MGKDRWRVRSTNEEFDIHNAYDLGLRPLATELEFKELVKHGLMHKIVEVYVEMLSPLNVEDDDEDEDSDYIVDDEDNSLTDVQVDMDEFRHAIDFEEDELSDEEDEQLPEEVDSDVLSIQEMLQQKFQIQITSNQIFKAKMKATQKIEGDFKGQYASLRDYCDEMIRCNPGSTCKIDIEPEANSSSPTRQFRRIYICLQGLKEGWKMSGREIIGLDGCFMKGPYPGQILTAVGVDANNGIYPVAYGIVESECAASWSWFLGYLGDDLGLSTRSNFTFISDRQKGIIPALARMFPNAEHRYCVRHIHENMKLRWRGPVFRDLIWKCARAATPQEFDVAMKEVYKENKDAHAWLKEIPPRHWSRSHFSGRSKSDLLINNLCEVFNRQLVGGRDKPIITCLEYIREYLMKRLVIVKKIIAKADGPLTPTIAKRFEFTKKAASNYRVFWNGETKYQVQSIGANEDQCIVQLDKKTCSCRKWELTGIPCRHAVACIWDQRDHGLDDGVVEKWVDEAYWLETWKKVYAQTIDPINGKRLWKPNECPTTLIPPKHHIQVGRPTKKRKKAADELSQSKKAAAEELSQTIGTTGKLPRRGNSVTCQICKQKGHNKRTCSQRIHVNQADGV
ncbi:hypothetical protein SSX86_001738 [Deinandra increscens subsp. villosa]|uniref:SWIM-type domain-containing protein n=1 Tax=Deinandra increscens subsp. villosa TaxID=3103831 RepID=A0AAP0DZN9_9ASTR